MTSSSRVGHSNSRVALRKWTSQIFVFALTCVLGLVLVFEFVMAMPPSIGTRQENAAIYFAATRSQGFPYSCVTVRWRVEQVKEVYFNGTGVEGGDSRLLCSAADLTASLRVVSASGISQTYVLPIRALFSPDAIAAYGWLAVFLVAMALALFVGERSAIVLAPPLILLPVAPLLQWYEPSLLTNGPFLATVVALSLLLLIYIASSRLTQNVIQYIALAVGSASVIFLFVSAVPSAIQISGADYQVHFFVARSGLLPTNCIQVYWDVQGGQSVSLNNDAVLNAGQDSLCSHQDQAFSLVVTDTNGTAETYQLSVLMSATQELSLGMLLWAYFLIGAAIAVFVPRPGGDTDNSPRGPVRLTILLFVPPVLWLLLRPLPLFQTSYFQVDVVGAWIACFALWLRRSRQTPQKRQQVQPQQALTASKTLSRSPFWGKTLNRYILPLAVALLPTVIILIVVASLFHASITDYKPVAPAYTDFLDYWHETATFLRAGFNGGYYGWDEYVPEISSFHFGVHGPLYPALYGLLAKVVGWLPYTGVLINFAILGIALFLFITLLKLDRQQILLVALLFAAFSPVLIYLPTTSEETLNQVIAIAMAGFFLVLLKRKGDVSLKWQLTIFFLLCVATVLRDSWAILFLPFFVLITKRRTVLNLLVACMKAAIPAILLTIVVDRTSAVAPTNFTIFNTLTSFQSGILAGLSTILDSVYINLASYTMVFTTFSFGELVLFLLPFFALMVIVLGELLSIVGELFRPQPGRSALERAEMTWIPAIGLELSVLLMYLSYPSGLSYLFFSRLGYLCLMVVFLAVTATRLLRRLTTGSGRMSAEQNGELLFHSFNLCVSFLLMLTFYKTEGEFRVLGAQLLLSLLFLIAYKRAALVKPILLLNLVAIPAVLVAFAAGQDDFTMKAPQLTEYSQALQPFVRYEEQDNAWCNTMLIPVSYLNYRAYQIPPGIGFAYIVVPSNLPSPVRSKYVWVPDDLLSIIKAHGTHLQLLRDMPDGAGSLYVNLDAACKS